VVQKALAGKSAGEGGPGLALAPRGSAVDAARAVPVQSAAPTRQAAPAPDLLGGLDDEPQRYIYIHIHVHIHMHAYRYICLCIYDLIT